METPANSPGSSAPGLAPVVDRNIRVLLERRDQEQRARKFSDRLADTVTRFAGTMTFVYVHLLLFGGWIVWNMESVPLPKFDPSLVILAMAASVEAIFLSTFILITQNRITGQAEKRADLDLQISLLAEHEITRIVTLVSEIAHKMGIDASRDPSLGPLKHDVPPEQVLDKIEAGYKQHNQGTV